MRAKDKKYFNEKIKTSNILMEDAKKYLVSHYTNGNYSDFLFFKSGKGSKVYDYDGNEYIDYAMGIGPLIMGHSHPLIVEAACEAVRKGNVHGMGNEYEIQFAELIVNNIKGADFVTFTNSGTEATMQAIKCARAYSGKEKIAKFEGHYHGTHDFAQISSRPTAEGPIEAPISTPENTSVPKFVLDSVVTLPFNRREAFDTLRKMKDEIGAVILEPIPLFCPLLCQDFIKELREVTKELNIVLIFDEVVTGFRIGIGGASDLFGVVPDLYCFGKAIGGGYPVGAVAGRSDIMNTFRFSARDTSKNKVFTTGTFNGNPVTCAAGVATLTYLLENPQVYSEMEEKTLYLRNGMEKCAKEIGFAFQTKGIGSFFVCYFTNDEVKETRDAKWKQTMQNYLVMRKYMLKNGIVLLDTGALYLSTEHTYEDLEKTLDIFKTTLQDML